MSEIYGINVGRLKQGQVKLAFVSYAREDETVANSVQEQLAAAGIDSFAYSVPQAGALSDEESEASLSGWLRKADVLVVVWSRYHAASTWCGWEVAEFLQGSDRSNRRVVLLPVDGTRFIHRNVKFETVNDANSVPATGASSLMGKPLPPGSWHTRSFDWCLLECPAVGRWFPATRNGRSQDRSRRHVQALALCVFLVWLVAHSLFATLGAAGVQSVEYGLRQVALLAGISMSLGALTSILVSYRSGLDAGVVGHAVSTMVQVAWVVLYRELPADMLVGGAAAGASAGFLALARLREGQEQTAAMAVASKRRLAAALIAVYLFGSWCLFWFLGGANGLPGLTGVDARSKIGVALGMIVGAVAALIIQRSAANVSRYRRRYSSGWYASVAVFLSCVLLGAAADGALVSGMSVHSVPYGASVGIVVGVLASTFYTVTGPFFNNSVQRWPEFSVAVVTFSLASFFMEDGVVSGIVRYFEAQVSLSLAGDPVGMMNEASLRGELQTRVQMAVARVADNFSNVRAGLAMGLALGAVAGAFAFVQRMGWLGSVLLHIGFLLVTLADDGAVWVASDSAVLEDVDVTVSVLDGLGIEGGAGGVEPDANASEEASEGADADDRTTDVEHGDRAEVDVLPRGSGSMDERVDDIEQRSEVAEVPVGPLQEPDNSMENPGHVAWNGRACVRAREGDDVGRAAYIRCLEEHQPSLIARWREQQRINRQRRERRRKRARWLAGSGEATGNGGVGQAGSRCAIRVVSSQLGAHAIEVGPGFSLRVRAHFDGAGASWLQVQGGRRVSGRNGDVHSFTFAALDEVRSLSFSGMARQHVHLLRPGCVGTSAVLQFEDWTDGDAKEPRVFLTATDEWSEE